MTLAGLIQRAVLHGDVTAAAQVAEFCRARGYSHDGIFKLVKQVCPTATFAQWDELLYEAEMEYEK